MYTSVAFKQFATEILTITEGVSHGSISFILQSDITKNVSKQK